MSGLDVRWLDKEEEKQLAKFEKIRRELEGKYKTKRQAQLDQLNEVEQKLERQNKEGYLKVLRHLKGELEKLELNNNEQQLLAQQLKNKQTTNNVLEQLENTHKAELDALHQQEANLIKELKDKIALRVADQKERERLKQEQENKKSKKAADQKLQQAIAQLDQEAEDIHYDIDILVALQVAEDSYLNDTTVSKVDYECARRQEGKLNRHKQILKHRLNKRNQLVFEAQHTDNFVLTDSYDTEISDDGYSSVEELKQTQRFRHRHKVRRSKSRR